MIDHMKRLYVELEPGKEDGPAMTYSERVDGLNEDALEMVEASAYERLKDAVLEVLSSSHDRWTVERLEEGLDND